MQDWFRHLRYGVRWIEPVSRRHSLAEQRREAAELGEKLGSGWALTSRSHSRGTIAVAVGNPPIVRLGIDVEFADPRRPWGDILGRFMDPELARTLDPDTCCRLWTFGEAHFKAFGSNPDAALLARVAAADPSPDEPTYVSARRCWFSERLRGDFWLTLVWEEAL